eukprot:161055-Prorocentrum_minimum.AAC.1
MCAARAGRRDPSGRSGNPSGRSGTLAVGQGTLAVGQGTLADGQGTLAVGQGTLNADAVELAVKTSLSRLTTEEFDSPGNSLWTPKNGPRRELAVKTLLSHHYHRSIPFSPC